MPWFISARIISKIRSGCRSISLKTFLSSVTLREIFMGSFSFRKGFNLHPYKGKEPFFLPLSNFTHKSLHYHISKEEEGFKAKTEYKEGLIKTIDW
jgi:hypothetical protein